MLKRWRAAYIIASVLIDPGIELDLRNVNVEARDKHSPTVGGS